MKTCGILIAKKNSKRFPDKNYLLYKNNLELMIDICGSENVYMTTNDRRIEHECTNIFKYGINVIWRGVNLIDDDQSYIEVLKFAWQSINKKYDYIISLVASSVGHKKEDILNGLFRLKNDYNSYEARSFDMHGN